MAKKQPGGNGQFTYDKYQKRKLREQMKVRRANVNNNFMNEWKKVCREHHSERRARIARFFYPPQWYLNVVAAPLKVFQLIMKWIIYWIIMIYSWVFVTWMLWIHDRVFLWGISKKIYPSKPGFMKMVIKVKGKIVREMEMQV